jgi:four helix bundle protein
MNSQYHFSFEKLEVWQESRALTKDLYRETQNFPKEEKFGIINQIR